MLRPPGVRRSRGLTSTPPASRRLTPRTTAAADRTGRRRSGVFQGRLSMFTLSSGAGIDGDGQSSRAFFLRPPTHSRQQIARTHTQRHGELRNTLDASVALAAFDPADVIAMGPRSCSQFFLGPPFSVPQYSNPLPHRRFDIERRFHLDITLI